MNENQITLISEDGTELLANILFTHEADGKNYVVFEFIESGDVSAAIFVDSSDLEGRLIDIETDEEWEMLDKLLDNFYDSLEDDEELDEDEDL